MRHVLYSFLILILSSVVFAGNNIWTSHGPFQSSLNHIEFSQNNPNIVFAWIDNRENDLRRSTDSGLTWQHLRFPSSYGFLTTLRIHPKNSNIVFGVAESVFISYNRGTTWQEISHEPFRGIFLYDLEFDPTDPNILYGVTRGVSGKNGYPASVYKSTDGGKTWSEIFNSFCCGDTDVNDVEIDQSNPKHIYVSMGIGLFRSTDAGAKWEHLNTKPYLLMNLTIDPSNGQHLYAANSKALYKTTDGGVTWYFAGTKCGPNISMDPKNPKNLYSVGFLANDPPCAVKSQDGGTSWQPISFPHFTPSDNFGTIAVNSAKPNIVLAASDLMYRSVNYGKSWVTIVNSKGNSSAFVIANSKPIPDVYAFNYNRLFVSKDANGKWRLLTTPPDFQMSRLLISPKDPSVLIAGGNAIPFANSVDKSLIVSSDGGNKWQYRKGPFRSVQELIMDPQDPNKLYAGGNVGSNFKIALSRSVDFGKSWQTTLTGAQGLYINISIDPLNSSVLYATSGNEFFRSINSGTSWKLYGNTPTGHDIVSMDVAPQRIYLLIKEVSGENITDLIYRSDDGGANFQLKNQGLPQNYFSFVKVHPTNPSIVFVGSDKGLYISNNEGESWELFKTTGLPQTPNVFNIAIPLLNPNQYFAGTLQGVFSITNK